MNSREVMLRLLRHWQPHKELIVPNCCVAGWESDLLIVRASGWADEVEIKISASDFRREWEKKAEKHEALELGMNIRAFNDPIIGLALNGESVIDDPTLTFDPRPWGGRGLHYVRRPHIVRRFWFAMPMHLAEKLQSEVPLQYGLLGVDGCTRVLRQPKILTQSRKVTDAERLKLYQGVYFKYWNKTIDALREVAVHPHDTREEALDWLLSLDSAEAPTDEGLVSA